MHSQTGLLPSKSRTPSKNALPWPEHLAAAAASASAAAFLLQLSLARPLLPALYTLLMNKTLRITEASKVNNTEILAMGRKEKHNNSIGHGYPLLYGRRFYFSEEMIVLFNECFGHVSECYNNFITKRWSEILHYFPFETFNRMTTSWRYVHISFLIFFSLQTFLLSAFDHGNKWMACRRQSWFGVFIWNKWEEKKK